MRLLISIPILLFIVSSYVFAQDYSHQLIEERYSDGKVYGVGTYKVTKSEICTEQNCTTNYISDGPYEKFYENGNMKEERNYTAGKRDGIDTTYFEAGGVEYESLWKMGKKNGPFKVYYSRGKLSMTGNAKNDQLDGEIKIYTPSGILIGASIYKEGKEIESHVAVTSSQVEDMIEEKKTGTH